jgi:hypothetical protein
MDETVLAALKERYKDLHPLLVHRSIERSKTTAELFDVLEGFRHNYPVVWDDNLRKWNHVRDIFQYKKLKKSK